MATTEEKIVATKQAISRWHKSPYCTGSCPLRLHLPTASDKELQLLADACEPATFGRNQADVLDESYRKARKMDNDKFFTKFTPDTYQLLERIGAQLLDGAVQQRGIRAEPYKLNVYGKDSFFKSHKDTPRGSNMFASLVVIFPTQHEGGALLLRHRGEEWSFDSATAVTRSNEPCFAYIAFYSDVEHEVSVVLSGYRITLTYNLYFKSEDALSALLDDPGFLPDGGVLGFGLQFMYPVDVAKWNLQHLVACLKGRDAMVKRVCEQLSLKPSLNAIYETDYGGEDVRVMTNEVFDLPRSEIEDLFSVLTDGAKGVPIYPSGDYVLKDLVEQEFFWEVAWISNLTTSTRCKTEYTAYGNEPYADHVYCDISLMVRVGGRKQNCS
ncbi:hypothetical protein BD779DRAFT_1612810 [Infundibulicybe gibba]|nr:hypothetical protein BD779DRAFT_1612810 [Infundibulicybe gibba]